MSAYSELVTRLNGGAENAGMENAGVSRMERQAEIVSRKP